eukprot:m.260268 g.260268  ORF g.260268 m.260268 type:complete len:162 (+) comp39569_c0_seq1:196-681(+)
MSSKKSSSQRERIGEKRDTIGHDLRKRIDGQFKIILQKLNSILKSNEVRGKGTPKVDDWDDESSKHDDKTELPLAFTTAKNKYSMEVDANSLVMACESLLTIAAELKGLLALNDHSAIAKHHRERVTELQSTRATTLGDLKQLRDDLGAHLYELETHCSSD